MMLMVLFHTGTIAAKKSISKIQVTRLNEAVRQETVISFNLAAIQAARFDPLEGRYHYIACATERLLERADKALGYCEQALKLEPADADHRFQMALVLSASGRDEEAISFYESSVKADRFNANRYVRLAQVYFSHEEHGKAFAAMSRALELEPQGLRRYFSIMALSGIADEDMAVILPEETTPHIQYASYLASVENHDAASKAYLKALDILIREPSPDLGYFLAVKNYFAEMGEFSKAIAAMEAARKRFPASIDVLMDMAGFRNFSGDTAGAIQNYREILLLDPGNQGAQQALDRLLNKQ
jgi:tetratricopeptide (TPR) repeat protein